jgi:3-hydroxybutyryl-CoA dehydrogenase
MGRGIAQVAAQSGWTTRLADVTEEAAAKAVANVAASLDRAVEKGKVTRADADATLSRLSPAGDPVAASRDADLVVEAVFEDIELKRRLFRDLDAVVPSHTVLASNTSSLPLAGIAEATRRPERVIGMHFFNPVPVMALLEIVRAKHTSDRTLGVALDAGRRMGKECIVVKDSPGFATSRLGVCIGLEAIRMLEEGVASAADIDRAMELGYRHPMGPLKLTDLVGLDVRLAIAEHLDRELRGGRFAPPLLLRRMVADGRKGQKTGEGFYRWKDGKAEPK